MTMSEAQVDAARQADPTAGEKLQAGREGAAFGRSAACVKLGLVDEASKEMKARQRRRGQSRRLAARPPSGPWA